MKTELKQRILCPIDFSEASISALRYAEELAGKLNAELVVAHAFKYPSSWSSDGQTEPSSDEVKAQMEAVECGVPFSRLMHAGPPGPVICWLAQEKECTLIVMSTRGRTGLKHLLLGSTAEYVLQHAPCPVLTTRKREQDEPRLEEPIVLPLPGAGP